MMEHQCLIENTEQQLLEIEMLGAMYPGKEELQMDDETILNDVQKWLIAAINNKSAEYLPPRISFKLRLTFDANGDGNLKMIDVNVLYPHEYPSSETPEIYVKSNNDALSRTIQCEINQALSTYLEDSVILGETCLISVISWLNENCPNYILSSLENKYHQKPSTKKTKSDDSSSLAFVRLWIYSHHIYSKIKRKDILDLSAEYQISGFCMPGKPGIICMEGTEKNCSDAWGIIKSWNWKKINVKHQESDVLDNAECVDDIRRFQGFEEIGFVKNSDTRDYHMDMGEFSKYLDEHMSTYIFKILFGFEK